MSFGCSGYVVGWQATQKCDVKYTVKKMDFFFRIFLFDTQRFKKFKIQIQNSFIKECRNKSDSDRLVQHHFFEPIGTK